MPVEFAADSTVLNNAVTGLMRLADKWKLNIICALLPGQIRYGQLKRQVSGVSQKVLTHCLREMEQDGLVMRKEFQEMPPRVEYALTEAGRALLPVMRELAAWNVEYFPENN